MEGPAGLLGNTAARFEEEGSGSDFLALERLKKDIRGKTCAKRFEMASRNFATRFLTYNVLSSSLSPASAYPSLVPAFLDPEYRWKLVLAKVTVVRRELVVGRIISEFALRFKLKWTILLS
jgi:hypothetical protein